MPDTYICEILENTRLTDTVYAITAGCDELAGAARAGQFVHISCGKERLLRRPISICNVVNGRLTFVFETRGDGTGFLSEQKPGTMLDILGPLGQGFMYPPDGRVITVGGGIGTPPMLFAAKSARSKVTAVLGFQDKSRILLKNEFEAVCDEVYITTDDGSFGIHGTVTAPLERLLAKGGAGVVLACGPRAMLKSVAELCGQYGVPCQVSLEERMGCGVGACVVCACKTTHAGSEQMSRVCKEGPVFDAAEVVW